MTVQALKEWKIEQPGGRQLVFGTASDKPDLLGNMQTRVLDKIQERGGVVAPVLADGKPVRDQDGKPVMAPKYSWHGLRHFAITNWIVGGRHDLKSSVQYLAGHATLTLTSIVTAISFQRRTRMRGRSEHEAALLG